MGSPTPDPASIATVIIDVDDRGEFVWQGLDAEGHLVVQASAQPVLSEVYDEIESMIGDGDVSIIDDTSTG